MNYHRLEFMTGRTPSYP